MQTTSLPTWDENTIEARVTIRRAIEEVFKFYRDFENLPRFFRGCHCRYADRSGNISMDDTGSAGHSSELDDKSERGAHKRVDPLRNGRLTWA